MNIECIRCSFSLLLSAGANIEQRDFYGNTPLASAIYKNNIECIKILVNRKAYINTVNAERYTPLMLAVEGRYLSLVQYLLEQGANISLKNSDGFTAEDIALKLKYNEIADLIVQY